ncbi:aldehyde dehydrogenase family protein [Rhodococcus olei]|uniref:aldehyde dehydrogenase (NAD(+)) n=1 Tax=Rhodococcus olei TaxID=2161675 RepID=A0ABP8PFK3_9NOCA
MTDTTRLFIAGEWREPAGTGSIDVENPATGRVCGSVPAGTVVDVDAAVAAARAAFSAWSRTTPAERLGHLERLLAAMRGRAEEIASVISMEMGAPLGFSRSVQAGLPIRVLEGFVRTLPEYRFEHAVGNSCVVREPAGVVAAITPWNYPMHQAIAKLGAALAAGCTVVLKPSQVTPLSSYVLAEAVVDAGLPAGVFNLVTGTGGVVGEALAAHPDVDVVSFTGSTSAGRRVAATAAGTIKRVGLELGGKSANVILPDADFERAVRTGTRQVLNNTGQTCTAWTRMLVPADRQEEAVALVREEMSAVVVGQPADESTTMGPLASADQRDTVLGYIEKGIGEGARLVCGGVERPDCGAEGHFVAPTAFADVTSDMVIAQEEIFGPVLSILPYRDEAHALEIANDSRYGLSGAVWSADQERATEFAGRMRTGQVFVNGGAFNPCAPFGGYKQSGIGRELGAHGLEDFLEVKAVHL